MTSMRKTTSGRRRGQRFDADHNVVTESLIFLGELDPDEIGEAIDDATHYEPTPLGDFEQLLQAVPEHPASFTFVDIGAGMGRVLMLASLHPFKQVAGFEASPALCEVARDNLVRWRKRHPDLPCKDLRVKRADAAHAVLPAGDAVFYLFNPFGERTMSALAARIAAGGSGRAYVLYHTPVHRHVFDENAAFEVVRELPCGLAYRRR